MQARAQNLDYTGHEESVSYDYRVCTCILLPRLFLVRIRNESA